MVGSDGTLERTVGRSRRPVLMDGRGHRDLVGLWPPTGLSALTLEPTLRLVSRREARVRCTLEQAVGRARGGAATPDGRPRPSRSRRSSAAHRTVSAYPR